MTSVIKTYSTVPYKTASGEERTYIFTKRYTRKRCNVINKTDIDSFLTSTYSIEEFVQMQRLSLKSFKEALLKHFISSVRRTD